VILMASYSQAGCLIEHTPSAAVAAGAVVLLGDLVTVATHSIAANAAGTVAVDGVWSIAKAAGAVSQGALLYWDATNSVVTTTASTHKRAGKAAAAAASGDASVMVILNVG
jgi:predicted RecA/RadA family phage recombinase